MPFEIRAHHLNLLKKAVSSTPREAVSNLIAGIYFIAIFKDGYHHDVMGQTTVEQLGYTRRMMKHYQTFQRLQEDDEIIVYASFDEYCRNSCIGEHCSEGEVNKNISEENMYTQRLLTILEEHPEINGTIRILERATQPNQVIAEKVLITDARTIRSALKYW